MKDKEESGRSTVIEIPVGETFDLEKAVCSHGLFMMSPNQWDPLSRTFSRPLRLQHHSSSSSSSSVWVSIYQQADIPRSLCVRLHGTRRLSLEEQQWVVRQVVRMLRLSERDDRNASLFQEMAEGNEMMRGLGGRVFRSPSLFEDMVKCILLCNCQWSRTLSMATALCQLQLELQSQSDIDDIIPKTPTPKESSKKLRLSDDSTPIDSKARNFKEECQLGSSKLHEVNSALQKCTQNAGGKRIGNFPSPGELAKLDERYLAKRCNLGYRASRILKLSQGVVEGRISLEELEQVSEEACLSSYDKLADQLRQIDGFGPFTCANVLMCMGYYHVIPTDSETIRHLKQIHSRNSTNQTIQKHVEDIYGKYAPFQFLAYWAELWYFYHQRFGKLSEMSCSDYKLITASNMRNKQARKSKSRTKAC